MTSTLMLGTPVTFHHRAAVARYKTKNGSSRWHLTEGVYKNEFTQPFQHTEDMFADWPVEEKRYAKINKTIMLWPEDGSGIIIGHVKRGIGTSHAPSGGGGGLFGDDWEPGFFDPLEFHSLYVVKCGLQGTEYILCPEWAVKPIHD